MLLARVRCRVGMRLRVASSETVIGVTVLYVERECVCCLTRAGALHSEK